jgi:hypothetical protein
MPLIQLDVNSGELTEVPITEIAIHPAATRSAQHMTEPGTWYPFETLRFSYDGSRPTRTDSIDKEDEKREVPDWDKKSRRTFVLDDVKLMHRGKQFPGSPIRVVTVTPPQWCNETTKESEMFEQEEEGVHLTFTPDDPDDVTNILLKLAEETSTASCDLSVGDVLGIWRMSNFPDSDDPDEAEEVEGRAYFYGRTETPTVI